MQYGRQFQIAGAAPRMARDQNLLRDENDSSCLSSAKDLSAHRKILLVIRDFRYVGSPDFRSLYVKVATLLSMCHLIGSQ